MRTVRPLAVALLALALPGAARAEDREFCADRPGLGTPPCTMAPGEAMVEIGLAEWDHTRDAASVENDLTLGDALARIGIARSAEVQIGLTGYQRERVRDRIGGALDRTSGAGDATLALRRGLAGPNGPVAIEGFVRLPLSHAGQGMGRVTGGALLPIKIELPAQFELDLTPEADLTANQDDHGRHLTWGGVVGLGHAVTKTLDATLELSRFRDDDPSGHATDARVAGSLAWQLGERFQLDVEVDVGLTHGAPDRAVLVGLARRFG